MKYLIVSQDFTEGMNLVHTLEKVTISSLIELAPLGMLDYFLTGEEPDVLVCRLDLGNVGISGIDVAKIVRKKNPHCIIVIITNTDLEGLGEGFKRLPDNFSEAQVAAVLREAVEDMEILAFQELAGQR